MERCLFNTASGCWCISFRRRLRSGSSNAGGSCIDTRVFWDDERGGADKLQGDFWYSTGLNAINGNQQHQLAKVSGSVVPLSNFDSDDDDDHDPQRDKPVRGCAEAVKWTELLRLVHNGLKLQAIVTIASNSTFLGPGDCLSVPKVDQWNLVFNDMQDGLFSDAVLRVGEREFRAHRVVLAAISPVSAACSAATCSRGKQQWWKWRRQRQRRLSCCSSYGEEVEVPPWIALQLYALADRYQLRSGLVQQMQLWLCTVALQPVLLCQLLPAAHTLCPEACSTSLYSQSVTAFQDIKSLPDFASWPLFVVALVVATATSPAAGFDIAAAWVEAQPELRERQQRSSRKRGRADDAKARWPDSLLTAIAWDDATQDGLQQIRACQSSCLMQLSTGGGGTESEARQSDKSELCQTIRVLQEQLAQRRR